MKTIPADIYDALHFSADAHGGVGAGSYYGRERDWSSPFCISAHIWDVVDRGFHDSAEDLRERAGLDDDLTLLNDAAVGAINRRKDADAQARVSWDEYVAEMGWERAA